MVEPLFKRISTVNKPANNERALIGQIQSFFMISRKTDSMDNAYLNIKRCTELRISEQQLDSIVIIQDR